MAEEKIKWTDEQEQAIQAINENSLVSASAGSGKTALMMEKVARLVINEGIPNQEKPVEIKKMMIVTFTKAVARELRTKVVKKLTEQIHKSPEKAAELRDQIEDVAIASISTIDSLCSTLVRMYFQKAEVDPSYAVMEQDEADLYFNRAMTKVLAQLDLEQNESYVIVKRLLGRDLNDNIKASYAFARNNVNYVDYLKTKATLSYDDVEGCKLVKDTVKEISEQAKEMLKVANECYLKTKEIQSDTYREKAFDCYLTLLPVLEKISKATSLKDIMEFGGFKYNMNLFSSKYKDELVYTEVQTVAASIAATLKETFKKYTVKYDELLEMLKEDRELLQEYIEVLLKIDAEYVRAKLEDNKLDFNDLEQKTAMLLTDDDIRAELQEKYDFVCVDEYQDINPLQEEILKNISRGNNLVSLLNTRAPYINRLLTFGPNKG